MITPRSFFTDVDTPRSDASEEANALATPITASPRSRVLIAIEGNIGIGKSTLIAKLRKHYGDRPSVAFVDEPALLWQHGALNRCAFQLMATRYAAVLTALESDASVIIAERSLGSDRHCLAAVGLESQEDLAAYAVTHDALIASLPKDLRMATVLLWAPRKVLHERIAKRTGSKVNGRDEAVAGSVGGIDDAYLANLDTAHANYYAGCGLAHREAVDASARPELVADAVISAIEKLQSTTPPSPTSIMESMEMLNC